MSRFTHSHTRHTHTHTHTHTLHTPTQTYRLVSSSNKLATNEDSWNRCFPGHLTKDFLNLRTVISVLQFYNCLKKDTCVGCDIAYIFLCEFVQRILGLGAIWTVTAPM
eukprot:Blabericola_migrator_1__11134@NODE_6518_length_516_cov_60_677060_g4464_i0_p1_GENE_NODE_6518_length_516_cov_60_677060_g4464_i0NODE_6518_length_516_cov_60_677060_g4464_i0_p1_ORF_typecomplete_len108_score24_98_NODE_6518_length_516_cov_60_677060_g4464_i0102425